MNKEKYEVLITAIEYIGKLNKGIQKATSFYRNGEITRGYELIESITEGIGWLVDVIILTQDVLETKIEVHEIQELIREYIQAMENEDVILMADLLEYEIAEMIQKWQQILIKSVEIHVNQVAYEG